MKTEFLKQRAEEFLETAKYHFKEEMYHLVAFDLEQAVQLYLKYYLYLRWKDFPKTYSIRELLKALGGAYNKKRAIEKIIKKDENLIADLEEAYISSRYLPAEFTKSQVVNLQKWTEKLITFLKTL